MTVRKITMEPNFEGKSVQANFSKEVIKEKLKEYKKIQPEKWKDIQVGDLMRYTSNGTFKSGGHVKRNSYPDYIVLVNYSKNISWCVQLKSDPNLTIYIKSAKKIKTENEKMKEVYKLYKEGLLKISNN